MANKVIPFEEQAVKEHLDDCISYWRKLRFKGIPCAKHYVDAYQSLWVSLFGETLKEPKDEL